jgi:hypothetical protein
MYSDRVVELELAGIGQISDSYFATVAQGRGDYRTPRGFYSCRERFHSDTSCLSTEILYACKSKDYRLKLAWLVDEIEAKLGVEEKIICADTNHARLMWIEISPWWQTPLRFQFLTCVCRAANVAVDTYGKPLLEQLLPQPYLYATKPAVEKFLDGYTMLKPGSYFAGWHASMTNGGIHNLIKPETNA